MAEHQSPDFADLLRRARRAAGLSQEELAERAGISARAISSLERGINRTPRPDTLQLLVEALALDPVQRRAWEQHRRRNMIQRGATAPATGRHLETTRSTNLPTRVNRFVGRMVEQAAIRRLLADTTTRVLTITGPGGVGKTRLAIEVATALLADYPDGVWFVDVAPVSDPDLVLSTVAETLGVQPQRDHTTLNTLAAWTTGKRVLLLLDNLEQVLDAAPALGELVARCGGLTVLATSRAPLRIAAEHEYPLQPLPLPVEQMDAHGKASDFDQLDVIQLFIDRAHAVRTTFDPVDEDYHVIAQITQRLDGLPLAIELAAASVRLLSPRAILDRMDRHLALPDASRRDAPSRHRSLQDMIAWSYDLLDGETQRIFRALSICKGGWTIDTAASIVGDERTGDILDGLARLVEQSLIQVDEQPDGEPRFTMLETIREYGLVQLTRHGELETIRARHAATITHLFTGTERIWSSRDGEQWLRRAGAEIENVRLALEWAIANEPVMALRLAREFAWIWFMRGSFMEAQHWLGRGLAEAHDAPDELRADALYWFGGNQTTAGRYDEARAPIEEALAIYRHLNHDHGITRCHHALARNAMFSGDDEQAIVLGEVAADGFRRLNPPELVGSLVNLGNSLRVIGATDRAEAVLGEALSIAEQHGYAWHHSMILNQLGLSALDRGDLGTARQHLRRCMEWTREVQDLRFVAQGLESCAKLAIAEGDPVHAGRLRGAAVRMRERVGTPIPPSEKREDEPHIATAVSTIGSGGWNDALAEGYALSPAEAIALALQSLQ